MTRIKRSLSPFLLKDNWSHIYSLVAFLYSAFVTCHELGIHWVIYHCSFDIVVDNLVNCHLFDLESTVPNPSQTAYMGASGCGSDCWVVECVFVSYICRRRTSSVVDKQCIESRRSFALTIVAGSCHCRCFNRGVGRAKDWELAPTEKSRWYQVVLSVLVVFIEQFAYFF